MAADTATLEIFDFDGALLDDADPLPEWPDTNRIDGALRRLISSSPDGGEEVL